MFGDWLLVTFVGVTGTWLCIHKHASNRVLMTVGVLWFYSMVALGCAAWFFDLWAVLAFFANCAVALLALEKIHARPESGSEDGPDRHDQGQG